MLIINCFGKNVLIDGNIVGYLTENAIFVRGKKMADITDDGVISINGREIGFVDDDESIIINGKEAGYINENNDFVFYKI